MREPEPDAVCPRRSDRRPPLALFAALLLLFAHPAFAANDTIDTLEWMTFDADLIVRGTVVEGHLLSGAKLPTDIVTAKVTDTLKGAPLGSVMFLSDAARDRPWDDGEYLFFLKATSRYPGPGCWRFFDTPDGAGGAFAWACAGRIALEPDGGVGVAYDGALRRLEKSSDILAAVRWALAHPPARQAGLPFVDIEVRPGTPLPPGASGEVRGHTLRLLLDAPAEAIGQKLVESADPHDRETGALILAHFKSAENIRRMTALLNDPYLTPDGTIGECTAVYYGHDKWAAGPYAIRWTADYALRQWRAEPAERAVLYQPKYEARYLPRWACAALAAGVLLLPLLLACGTIVVTRRFTRGVWALSILLLLASTAGWIRSVWRIDELAFTAGKARYELVARAGGIRIMRLEDAPDVFPAAFTSVPRTPTTDADWEPQTAGGLRSRDNRLGVERTRGTVWYAGETYVMFTAFVFPWWMLCAASAVPPAFVTATAAILRRRNARKASGRCHQCGYDLRASPAGCPECGWGR